VEDDHDLALVAVGGVVDSWIDKACRSLHFDMPIEDRTPLAIIPHLMTDDHHSHGILLLLPVRLRRRRSSLVATFILPADLARRKACESLYWRREMPSILQRGGRPSQGSKSRRAHLGVATTSRSGMTTCGCGRCGTPSDVIA